MSNRVGIMQGRLVPPEPGRFQAFPRTQWRDEFALAASVPVHYIEWIYDAHGEDVNPICTDRGIAELRRIMHASGVSLRAVCADYFMDYPLLRTPEAELQARAGKLLTLIRTCERLGIGRITLPFVDASRIETAQEEDRLVETLTSVATSAQGIRVEIHLESSLPPGQLAAFLDRLPDPRFKINYDSGNSASLGYVPREEFAAYGERIGSVHVKDRVLGGGTVPLGEGSTDFASVFDCLNRIHYGGDFTLQVARGADGDEVDWMRRNLDFVSRFWPIPEELWTLA